VSMFFLISYGLLNYATYYEARAASPSFRPRFKWYHARLSLAGGLICLGAMLAINLPAGVVAVAFLFAIFQYLRRTAGPARWADSRRSYHLQQARENLLNAVKEPEHARDWRPQMLLFSDDPVNRKQLLRFAAWIEGESGFVTLVGVLKDEGLKTLKQKADVEAELRADIQEAGVDAFPLVVTAPDVAQGLRVLVQSFGIGPLYANTALFDWPEHMPAGNPLLGQPLFGRMLKSVFRLGCNIISLDSKNDSWTALASLPSSERRIDVWWWGDATSRLMLLLAYLMTRTGDWKDAKIRVLAAGFDINSDKTVEDLHKTLEEVRIEAEPEVIIKASDDAVAAYSSDASLVFLPFRLKGDQLLDPFDAPLVKILTRLPVTVLVLAAEDIDLEAEPEDGTAGEIAQALDARSDAEKKAKDAETDAVKASENADEKLHEMLQISVSGDKEALATAKIAALKAKEDAIKAARRAAKALAKAENTARRVERLGVKPE